MRSRLTYNRVNIVVMSHLTCSELNMRIGGWKAPESTCNTTRWKSERDRGTRSSCDCKRSCVTRGVRTVNITTRMSVANIVVIRTVSSTSGTVAQIDRRENVLQWNEYLSEAKSVTQDLWNSEAQRNCDTELCYTRTNNYERQRNSCEDCPKESLLDWGVYTALNHMSSFRGTRKGRIVVKELCTYRIRTKNCEMQGAGEQCASTGCQTTGWAVRYRARDEHAAKQMLSTCEIGSWGWAALVGCPAESN